jgi:hypothetical protein
MDQRVRTARPFTEGKCVAANPPLISRLIVADHRDLGARGVLSMTDNLPTSVPGEHTT